MKFAFYWMTKHINFRVHEFNIQMVLLGQVWVPKISGIESFDINTDLLVVVLIIWFIFLKISFLIEEKSTCNIYNLVLFCSTPPIEGKIEWQLIDLSAFNLYVISTPKSEPRDIASCINDNNAEWPKEICVCVFTRQREKAQQLTGLCLVWHHKPKSSLGALFAPESASRYEPQQNLSH